MERVRETDRQADTDRQTDRHTGREKENGLSLEWKQEDDLRVPLNVIFHWRTI